MSILKNVAEKCAEGVFNEAVKQNEKTDCLWFSFYEPEYFEDVDTEEE